MPILGWSEHALDIFSEGSDEAVAKLLVSYQPYTYFIFLAFARLAWCQQSLFHAFLGSPQNKTTEMWTLSLHWLLYLGVIAWKLPLMKAVTYLVVSQATCGLLLALVFSLNHNGMPIYSMKEAEHMDFYRKQILTGRDVDHNILTNWFTGGLNYQIEHHLFPSMPRHNFGLIEPRVRALCEKHKIAYHKTGFLEGTYEVLGRLQHIAALARKLKAQ
jgi:fatty acid desaturase